MFKHNVLVILIIKVAKVFGWVLQLVGKMIYKIIKGPYADHIPIPQGSTGSSTFF